MTGYGRIGVSEMGAGCARGQGPVSEGVSGRGLQNSLYGTIPSGPAKWPVVPFFRENDSVSLENSSVSGKKGHFHAGGG
jgi:hypothetical protein